MCLFYFYHEDSTMTKKKNVLILCGGRSAEHEVSLQSAKNLIEAIDKTKYALLPVGIHKDGRWYLYEGDDFLVHKDDPKNIALKRSDTPVLLAPWRAEKQLIHLSTGTSLARVDVAFPILHGPFGEDGTVQGLLKLADIPFVGADVLGSAVGMDKDVAKRLLRDAGLPVADFLTYLESERNRISFTEIEKKFGLPVFIKPANLGSSVGISKVAAKEQFDGALDEAFRHDSKVIIENYIEGREIECAVLGNEQLLASVPGEIVAQHEFYSYDAKYIDEHGALLKSPADLPEHIAEKVKEFALRVYRVLCCQGMARVDFFLRQDETLIVSELNTIPGFTKISLYPKLMELSGIPYGSLIDRLLELAIERHRNAK